MRIFEAGIVQFALDELRDIACIAAHFEDESRGTADLPDRQFIKRACSAVELAIHFAKSNDFGNALTIAQRAKREIEHPMSYATIRSEVNHVADAFGDELHKRSFALIPANLTGYLDNPHWIGEEVCDAFRDARGDISQAGNCLALDCNTAAVFHLMRVVEWGLRYLCSNLGLRRVRRKKKLIPITYVDWESMLNQLRGIVDSKIEKMRRGRDKQLAQEFYYPALQDIRGIRDAWRNHLMHTRATYSADDALAICGHVKRLMASLAKHQMQIGGKKNEQVAHIRDFQT